MIKVYTLENCQYCKSFLDNFKATRMPYDLISADEGGEAIDRLEDMLNTAYYPIVITTKGSSTTHFVSDNSKRPSTVTPTLHIKYYQSIPHLITLILKTIQNYEK